MQVPNNKKKALSGNKEQNFRSLPECLREVAEELQELSSGSLLPAQVQLHIILCYNSKPCQWNNFNMILLLQLLTLCCTVGAVMNCADNTGAKNL